MVRWTSVRAALAAVILLPVALAGSPVAACSGSALSDEPGALEPDVIFTGTAVRRDDPRWWGGLQSSADLIEWTFVVDEVRKGAPLRRVTIRSERSGASCGYEFQLGSRYRVQAVDFGEGLRTLNRPGTKKIEPLADPPRIEGSFAAFYLDPMGVLVIAELGLLAALIYTTRLRRSS